MARVHHRMVCSNEKDGATEAATAWTDFRGTMWSRETNTPRSRSHSSIYRTFSCDKTAEGMTDQWLPGLGTRVRRRGKRQVCLQRESRRDPCGDVRQAPRHTRTLHKENWGVSDLWAVSLSRSWLGCSTLVLNMLPVKNRGKTYKGTLSVTSHGTCIYNDLHF